MESMGNQLFERERDMSHVDQQCIDCKNPEDTHSASSCVSSESKRRRSFSADDNDSFGWFEDFDSAALNTEEISETHSDSTENALNLTARARTLPPPATEPPVYVLESSLSYQELWYQTAGQRPRQPCKEREHYEKLWEQIFDSSEAAKSSYTRKVKPKMVKRSGSVIFKGKGPHSATMIKAFTDYNVASMTLQVYIIMHPEATILTMICIFCSYRAFELWYQNVERNMRNFW